MKKLFLPFVASFLLLAACNSKKSDTAAGEDGAAVIKGEDVDKPIDEKEKKKNITDRDLSISKENAYNDIFLDSLAMERYIASRGLSDKKISRRIRSFYNARNYQYAWFSSGGLTEQCRFFWNQYDYAVTHLKDSSLMNSEFYTRAERYLNTEKLAVSTKD
ncbi:MAG: hypothetical protein JNM88_02570, partial [Chitinophagaceae bacterium]|nr:hypothetical protein [Chitinophagaceae bacterium]